MDNQALFLREFFTETLYKVPDSPLSIPKNTDNPAEINSAESFSLSGNKSADVLFLFAYAGESDIPAADKEVLTRLLTALGLGWPKVAWANSTPSLSWNTLIESFGGTRIVIFQSPAPFLPEALEDTRPGVIEGRKVICTGSIAELEENKIRKTLLWKGLQEMFGL